MKTTYYTSEGGGSFKCVFCGKTAYSPIYPEIKGNDNKIYSLLECQDCGLNQIYPMPSSSEIEDFYANAYTGLVKKGIVDIGGIEENAAAIEDCCKKLELVKKYSGITKGKLLDVGCGHGFFLYAAALDGGKIEATGLDIDSDTFNYAKNVLNVNVIQHNLEELDLLEDRYDIISFWMVLEHLRKPKKILENAASILNKKGVIVGGVPNINGIGHRIQKDKWYEITIPEHLIYFSEKTLEKMLISIGLEPLYIGTIPIYATPEFKLGWRKNIATLAATSRNKIQRKFWLTIHKAMTLIKRYLCYWLFNFIIIKFHIPGNSLFFVAKKP